MRKNVEKAENAELFNTFPHNSAFSAFFRTHYLFSKNKMVH